MKMLVRKSESCIWRLFTSRIVLQFIMQFRLIPTFSLCIIWACVRSQRHWPDNLFLVTGSMISTSSH